MATKASYAVLGVGAVGGLYGGLLAKAGFPVHFLARSDFLELKQNGLRVESKWGDFLLATPKVYSEAAELPKVDCVLVAWKSTSNHQLASILPRICHEDTLVVMLQNGLDVERAAAEVVGADRVLGGCIFLCCNKVGPGHIRHLDYGSVVLAKYTSSASQLASKGMQTIVDDFRAAGIDVESCSDLRFVRWKKLAWNIPFNGLSVVLNADTSQIMENEGSRILAENLSREVLQSAAACGVEIPASHVEENMKYTRNMVPYASSMLLDYQNRRELELDAIFGTPIRMSRLAGFEPLRVEMLYQQLRFLDWKNRGCSTSEV